MFSSSSLEKHPKREYLVEMGDLIGDGIDTKGIDEIGTRPRVLL